MSEDKLTIADAEKRRVPCEASDELRVPVECYSRVVGYLRPVQDWPIAKQQEFADRVVFKLPKSVADDDV